MVEGSIASGENSVIEIPDNLYEHGFITTLMTPTAGPRNTNAIVRLATR